ncbi:MAG TPA: hypothetical protein ENK50_01365 [Sedimenticola sp.]|nr:hypothetical protein [Sedimenticola sp.]
MDSRTSNQLTVEQAKQRLREVSSGMGPAGWIRENPLDALLIAFSAGLLAGAEPRARAPLAEALSRILSEGLVASAVQRKTE